MTTIALACSDATTWPDVVALLGSFGLFVLLVIVVVWIDGHD